MSRPYYQRVPFRLLRLLQREAQVQIGTARLNVPLSSPHSLAHLYWRAGWKTQLIASSLAARPGAFLDVGVNVGTTLLDFLSTDQRGAYFGFEPNPTCAALCQQLLARNGLARCRIVPAALSDTDALACLHLEPGKESDPAATLVQEIRPGHEVHTEFVACYRFDSLRPTLATGKVSLVKIDVEGAELGVLQGMSELLRSDRPWIICEVLHADAQIAEADYVDRTRRLAAHLAASGYTIRHIRKSAAHELIELPRFEEFPFLRWTPERAEECDYLFVPQEASEAAVQQLLAGRAQEAR